MNYKDVIISVLDEMGIFIDVTEEVCLNDYIADSIQFIQFIVALEEALGFEFPDEYLNYESMESMEKLLAIIELAADERAQNT